MMSRTSVGAMPQPSCRPPEPRGPNSSFKPLSYASSTARTTSTRRPTRAPGLPGKLLAYMAWSSSRTWAIFLCAVRALRRHKLRSGLSTLGVTIGIAAVVLVVAIGNAGSARTADQLKQLGDNLVWVEAGSRNINGARTGSHGTTSLTLGDL